MINKYAELIVKQGVNLQKGQDLVITADVECNELVKAIAKKAFEAGARDVVPYYVDDEISRLRYENNDIEFFKEIPSYIKALRNDYALKNAAVVSITSEDPELMKGIDPLKMMARSKAMHEACDIFYDHLDRMIDRWCIVGAPSLKWANKVFKDMSDKEAIDALWNAIYHVTYVDKENPVEYWNKHRKSFEERVKKLNEMNIESLYYENSLGTSLTVGLTDDYLFAGGGSYTQDGIYSFPNIPTEEIFTSPHYKLVNGTVYSSMPLNHNGAIVDDFYLTFKDGKVVDYRAKVGEDVLKSILNTDEGALSLGEIALVPYSSPIRETGILFYNTLFDENASCHVALGKGFSECIKNGMNMTKEEMKNLGVNDSLTHVDFMIGTKDLHIEATLKSGEKVDIFKDGEFVI